MNRTVPALLIALSVAAGSACQLKDENAAPAGASGAAAAAMKAPPDVAAPPADALRTPSGLASKVIIVGMGTMHPTPRSTVTVHYTGWTPDGQMFDSSYRQGRPISFPLDQVISGWVEGLQLMVVGEKRRFWIPGPLAYDNLQVPGAPKGMLVFDIELLDLR
jgi:FKBP-type peptidyl-prolyl cis-trans isomerase